MKICFVTGHYAPFVGGVETHVERIAIQLARGGDQVTVLTQADGAGQPVSEDIDGVLVHRFQVPVPSKHFAISPQLLWKLRRVRRDWDVFHAHGYHGVAPLAALIAQAKPLVFTPHYHGTGHSVARKLAHVPYRWIGRRIARGANRIICVSNAERDLFVGDFPVAGSKTQVIPNGVDLERLLAAKAKGGDKKTIISAGRLESYKHVEITVRAMTQLDDSYHLIVTGEGVERARLEALVAELGLRSQVTFVGVLDIDELYAWFRSASVYVSMSTNEAMPVTIVELLAAGAMIVASDIPAHRDLMSRYAEWISTVPVGSSPDVLARAIESATTTQSLHAPVVPSWSTVAATTRKVYEDVLSSD